MGEAAIKRSPADSLVVSEVPASSPDMSDDRFAEFVADIREHGQLVPIWVCDGEVIDGRKRLRACRELGIEVRWIETGNALDAEALSRSLNALRTHYTRGQLAMYAARLTDVAASPGRRRAALINNDQCLKQRDAAKLAGVAQSAVSAAAAVMSEGAPEVADAVSGGRLTLNTAHRLVKLVPLDEQPAAVAKLAAANAGKRRQSTAPIDPSVAPGFKRMPRKPVDERMGRALEQLENTVGIVEQFIDEAGRCDAAWAGRLRACRTTITRLINQAKED